MTNISAFENITYKNDIKTKLTSSFQQVIDILKFHSGPFATNAVIGSQWRQHNTEDEMMKDGIKILNHLLADEDPGARFAIRLARYVGTAVDHRCHDGTTTSMLMLCQLAILAIQKMDADLSDKSRYVWVENFTRALRTCLTYLETLKITDEDIFDRCAQLGIETNIVAVRGAMAYHMAMISSKGDDDLATKIASLVTSSPKKIYGMYRNIPLAIETKERYTIKRQEFDLVTGANLVNMNVYNHKNDTQFLSENAVIFATANDLSMNSLESGFLHAFISTRAKIRADLARFSVDKGWEAYHEGKRNLVIMAPNFSDPHLIELVNEFNTEHPQCKIAMVVLQVEPKIKTSFNKTLHYMAGKPVFDDVSYDNPLQSFIGLGDFPARVHSYGAYVTIHNLYKRTEDQFHPFYNNPDAFPAYTEYRLQTEELIQFAQDNIANSALDHRELTILTSLYRSLTSQRIYDIEVGGSRHTQAANKTVYEDAIGAALSAVDEGVVLGGFAHLAKMARTEGQGGDGTMALIAMELITLVAQSLRVEGNGNSNKLIDLLSDDKWSYMVAARESYGTSQHFTDYVKYGTLDENGLRTFLSCDKNNPVLLQAYAGYEEAFFRYEDMLGKLANVTHYIDMRRPNDAGGV